MQADTPRKDLVKIAGLPNPVPPLEASNVLSQRKNNPKAAAFWDSLEVVVIEDPGKPPSCKGVRLKCSTCKQLHYPSNPSKLAKEHFDAAGDCKVGSKKRSRASCGNSATATASTVTVEDLDEEGVQEPPPKGMKRYTVPPAQAAAAINEFIKGLITASTPSAIENKHFKKAFSILGVDSLPSAFGQAARLTQSSRP
jgi:hypothetical protein